MNATNRQNAVDTTTVPRRRYAEPVLSEVQLDDPFFPAAYYRARLRDALLTPDIAEG